VSLLGSIGGLFGINEKTINTAVTIGKGFLAGGPAGAAAAAAQNLAQNITAGRVTTTNPQGMIGTSVLKMSTPLTQQATATQTIVNKLLGTGAPVLLPKVGPGMPPPLPDSTKTSGVSLFPGGPMVGTQTQYYSPQNPPPAGTRGYHLNKTGYYTKGGTYVAPQSKWVKNRRRNPLNPRALSRSISRISSAKNAARFLSRVTVRDAKACG
jgi:hypothetical protein